MSLKKTSNSIDICAPYTFSNKTCSLTIQDSSCSNDNNKIDSEIFPSLVGSAGIYEWVCLTMYVNCRARIFVRFRTNIPDVFRFTFRGRFSLISEGTIFHDLIPTHRCWVSSGPHLFSFTLSDTYGSAFRKKKQLRSFS